MLSSILLLLACAPSGDVRTPGYDSGDTELDDTGEVQDTGEEQEIPEGDGTPEAPHHLAAGPLRLPFHAVHSDTTAGALSDAIDAYPPFESIDESGPEVLYTFELDQPAWVSAELIQPEPGGVDVDVHLLDSLEPVHALARDDAWVGEVIPAGRYWLALDTYAGDELAGDYTLMVQARTPTLPEEDGFNEYILAAVEELYEDYGLLGYDSAVLTHDIDYGGLGTIERSGGARTMCVAAVMEVILTAMQIYARETGDDSVFHFLPVESWEGFGAEDIKAHLWVSYELETAGAADALRHFGMGMNVPFEELRPGSVVGINRTTGSGHAVIFLGFIDGSGRITDSWHDQVVGFYYFSSQGGYDEGSGGLDYRYAVFSEHGSPEMPYKRDLNIIYSTDQGLFNTGMMLHPDQWWTTPYAQDDRRRVPRNYASFDSSYFTGWTTDD